MPTLTDTELTTPRLLLRRLTEADTDAWYEINTDPEVTRYLSHGPWTERAQAEEAIARSLQRYAEHSELKLAVTLRDGGRLIGTAGLFAFVDGSRRCDVGYALGRAHWGRGYAFEALRALLDHGFDALDLNRVEADIDPANVGSARLLEKLGFRKEGFMPERWLIDGEFADTVNYGLLRRYRHADRQAGGMGVTRPPAPSTPGSTGDRPGPRNPG